MHYDQGPNHSHWFFWSLRSHLYLTIAPSKQAIKTRPKEIALFSIFSLQRKEERSQHQDDAAATATLHHHHGPQ
jgi:hypothetical protein